MKLRLAGHAYSWIADRCVEEFGRENLPKHWDKRSVYKDVKRELDMMRAELTQDTESVRTLELQRLDRLFAGVWEEAQSGKPSAIDRALKIMERRARLLGIDAPEKFDGDIATTIKVEYVRDPIESEGATPESEAG